MSIKNFLFKLPDIFKKKSSDALTNSITEFPQLDLPQLSEEWKLAELGSSDGEQNIPDSDAKEPSSHEQQIVATFSGAITESKNQAISFIQEYERQFRNMALSETIAKMKNFARNAQNEFESIIQQADDELHTSKNSYESLKKKYDNFRNDNQLEYEAHYPASKTLLVGILCIEVIIETLFNYNFFANISESFIIGGIIIAFGLSIFNVCFLGYLFGKYIFWYKNHINPVKKSIGWMGLVIFFLLAFGLNYFIANYRFIAEGDEAVLITSKILNSFNNMLNPSSLDIKDWMLFLIGFAASVIAFITSYKMDDSYPGYGETHRALEVARVDYIEEKRKIEDDLKETKDNQLNEVTKLSDRLTLNYNSAKTILSDEESYLSKWNNHFSYLESACKYCVTKYRENNIAKRSAEKPQFFSKTFKFEEAPTFETEVEQNKGILKETAVYVDQIGKHLTEANNQILNNYEASLKRFRVIEEDNKLEV